MAYVLFSLWFTLLHTAVYTIAGAIALRISKDLYEEKNRLLDFLRVLSSFYPIPPTTLNSTPSGLPAMSGTASPMRARTLSSFSDSS
jgi:hypothetical protein